MKRNEQEARHAQQFAKHEEGLHRKSDEAVKIGIISSSKTRAVRQSMNELVLVLGFASSPFLAGITIMWRDRRNNRAVYSFAA